MNSALMVITLLLLLLGPGLIIARCYRLPLGLSLLVAPAVTYGAVGLAIIPFGAVGIPWNGYSAAATLVVLAVIAYLIARRWPPQSADDRPRNYWSWLPTLIGILAGGAVILVAAHHGIADWQSIPSNWDSMWHANTVRYILETGQASSTRMGDLRNIETHESLYYPSSFHALAAVAAQLNGAAPATAYTYASITGIVALIPMSAAAITWFALQGRISQTWIGVCAGSAALLSAAFQSIPYVEFNVAAIPNLNALALAGPVAWLCSTTVRHRRRIPVAALALIGIASLHASGGVVTAILLGAWWLTTILWHPVRGRIADLIPLASVALIAVIVMIPQIRGVLNESETITAHEYEVRESRLHALADGLFQHTRHLADFPIQKPLLMLAAIGIVALAVKRIFWPILVWAAFVVAIVQASVPFHGALGKLAGIANGAFYNDPRRLSTIVCAMLGPMAGIGLVVLVGAPLWLILRRREWLWQGISAACVLVIGLAFGHRYFDRNAAWLGQNYNEVMVSPAKLEAFHVLASLPGARDGVIADSNTDGTGWMYATDNLNSLWKHYYFPREGKGPGQDRFLIWSAADEAATNPEVRTALRDMHVRYAIVGLPDMYGFTRATGFDHMDTSPAWRIIFNNGENQIYELLGD